MNPPGTVISLTTISFVGCELSIMKPIESAAESPEPHIVSAVLIDDAHVTMG